MLQLLECKHVTFECETAPGMASHEVLSSATQCKGAPASLPQGSARGGLPPPRSPRRVHTLAKQGRRLAVPRSLLVGKRQPEEGGLVVGPCQELQACGQAPVCKQGAVERAGLDGLTEPLCRACSALAGLQSGGWAGQAEHQGRCCTPSKCGCCCCKHLAATTFAASAAGHRRRRRRRCCCRARVQGPEQKIKK